MGRSITPLYIVEVVTDRGRWTPTAWRTRRQGQIRGDGSPTLKNLTAWVAGYEASTQPGGSNSHLSPTRILRATLRRNGGDRAILAEVSQ